MDDPARDELLAVKPTTAARLLDVSRSKVYELIKAGVLKTVPFGADQRIPMTELRRVAAEGVPVASVRRTEGSIVADPAPAMRAATDDEPA